LNEISKNYLLQEHKTQKNKTPYCYYSLILLTFIMRSYSFVAVIFVLCLALLQNVHAGWFGESDSGVALKKNLAKAEKEARIKSAEAKATAKEYKADLSDQRKKAKAQAEKRAKTAEAEARGFFAKKKQQLKNIFN